MVIVFLHDIQCPPCTLSTLKIIISQREIFIHFSHSVIFSVLFTQLAWNHSICKLVWNYSRTYRFNCFNLGYEYKYPFLSPECKITVDKMVVKPLYKHFINIEHPTMCIIGIPRDCPGFTMFDLQVSIILIYQIPISKKFVFLVP